MTIKTETSERRTNFVETKPSRKLLVLGFVLGFTAAAKLLLAMAKRSGVEHWQEPIREPEGGIDINLKPTNREVPHG